ncbi:MAG: phage tail protein [Pseudomonadota bacterium]
MSLSVDEIFELLPAYLRVRDATEGQRVKGRVAPGDDREAEDFGPLRNLASLIAREGQIVEESLHALYDDAFIETCAPWVIPYLGDLLGVRGLSQTPKGIDMRARVADALSLRARKGTLRALEHAAAKDSGWPVYAVEYWKRLNHAQSVRLIHPEQGASVDMRNKSALARVDTPFEQDSRSVDVRRIDTSGGGKWNLSNIGLHVWRLIPYSLTGHVVQPVSAGRRDFRFHPLGCDAGLFDLLGVQGDIDTPAAEAVMPSRITRAIMAERPDRFYGPDLAIEVRVGGAAIPVEDIKTAHLGDLPTGEAEPDWNHTARNEQVLIDPELGRLKVGPDLTGPVRITCHFARPLELGGGEHGREGPIGSVEGGAVVAPSISVSNRISSQGGAGVFLLDQTTRYTAGGIINVPADGLLKIVGTDGHFPTLRLTAPLEIALGNGAEVELNGLRVFNNVLRVTGTGAKATLKDCTLVPGRSLRRDGAAVSPGAAALELDVAGATLCLERCIAGPVRLTTDVDASFEECIIDAGSSEDPAIFAAPGSARHVMRLDRSTVRGRVETDAFSDGARSLVEGIGVRRDSDARLATSDTLFVSAATPAVQAARRQVGCIRFSYVPQGSFTPRLYRCVERPAPVFSSLRYADPDYMLLAPEAGDEFRRGAAGGGEIGAYNRAAHTARADNIRRSISDFLRFGHRAGVFHET